MKIRFLLFLVFASLALNVCCQNQAGVDRMGELLRVYCDLIDNWEVFNNNDFEDVEELQVFDLKEKDSLDFFKFKNVKSLVLSNVKLRTPFVVSHVFPKLENLDVVNNGFSNVSYAGLQDLEFLRIIWIGDKYFRKTATLSKLRNVKVLGIADNLTLRYFQDHLDELISDSLDELRITSCSSRKTNLFMEEYFNKFEIRKVHLFGIRKFVLRNYYNFDILITDRFPVLSGFREDKTKKVIIDKYWVSLKSDIDIIDEISKNYLTDVFITVGIKECADSATDYLNTERLNFYVVGDRIRVNCNGFIFKRINRARYLDIIWEQNS